MKQGITIQERLKDLRTERHLKLEELAAATKISKSALGSYENDELKEISHKNLVELAKFYGVSTDYLLCLTENRNHPDTGLTELHLSDDMVELLKSGRINNRLLCEIATHEEWDAILRDIRLDHEADAESAPNDSSTLKMIADVEKAMRFQGNALDKFCYVMCSQLQISYEKLTEKERTDLKNIMKKSSIYRDSPLGSRKR